jgi:Mg-chelatase subunit ChlD
MSVDSGGTSGFPIDDRGVSEVVGYVLLVGMVVGGMSLVLLAGGTAIEDLRDQSSGEAASLGMGEFDARVGSLATSGINETGVRFPTRQVNRMDVVPNSSASSGRIHIAVNEGPNSCAATVPMSTVTYERDGETIGYQAGGIWRSPVGSDSSAMATPPDFDFEDGTLDAKVVNLSGEFTERRVTVRKLAALSGRQTNEIEEELFNGTTACRRPDNVTVRINSTFHQAWARHVRKEVSTVPATDRDVTVSGGNVTLELYQNALPDAANDSRNDVVRFYDGTGGSPPPETDGAYVPIYDNASRTDIGVDKLKLADGNNNYTMTVRPVANGTQVSFPDSRDADDAVYRTPLDVVFVIDESGSMGYNANTNRAVTIGGTTYDACLRGDADTTPNGDEVRFGIPDGLAGEGPNPALPTGHSVSCERKYEGARIAAKEFVGNLNESVGDRIALIGFTSSSRKLLIGPDDDRFSNDFPEVNSTIDTTQHSGGTRADRGMRHGLDTFGLASNSSHQKVMIVLSDGVNNNVDTSQPEALIPNGNMYQHARWAEQNGITVYTVGFGDPIYLNETALNETAIITGGTYYNAENSSQLTDAFENIFANISSSSVIVNDPVQMNMSVSGGSPAVEASVGDGDDAARIGGGYNANDPVAASFDLSTNVDDGNVTNITAYQYDCNEYRTTNIVRRNSTNGEERVEIRCVDPDTDSRSPIPISEKDIYIDGDSATPVLSKPTPWWEGNLSASLAPYVDESTDQFDLASNQAIVSYQFGTYSYNGTTYHKRMIMLYEVGVSNEFRASDVVDVEVVSAEISDD